MNQDLFVTNKILDEVKIDGGLRKKKYIQKK